MKFVTIDQTKFRKFADSHPNKSFYQTPEIAKLREAKGWTTYYFAVEEKNKILAAAFISAKPTFLGKSLYYCPGGPLIDYEDKELVTFFFKNLKKYAKSHNGYLLHIEPNYELIERDREGAPVKAGYNHQSAVDYLRALGFVSVPPDSPQYLFVLNITDRNPDKLFAGFKQNTRNLINRTARKGIKVRELAKSELGILKQITESTAARRDFTDKPLEYYEQMYDLYHARGEVIFLVAEVEDDNKTIPLSAAMFMLYGDEVVYLFSGSDEQYMREYNAQYAIQWYMIQYALKHKFKRYNFYGIQGLPDPHKPGHGIYEFKKGFTNSDTGRVVELLGAFELPINAPFYHLHRFLSKLKHH